MSDQDNNLPMPATVRFLSQGIDCIAFSMFGSLGLNMQNCQINLNKDATINITPVANFARVIINDGSVWFDTSEESAAEIKHLFETGKAMPRE